MHEEYDPRSIPSQPPPKPRPGPWKHPKQPYDPDPEMTINPRTKPKNFGSI
jgi:hypothetical protein